MAAPLYFNDAHPLLSDDAQELDSTALEAHAVVAEQVLGLAGTDLEDDAITQAGCAVALQINYQVALPPEVWAIKVDKTGPLETQYRDALPEVNPLAAAMVSSILTGAGEADAPGAGWNFMGPRR